MKTRISDRKWITFILFLLAVEILWLLADMQIIQIPFLSKKTITTAAKEAGYVIKITDQLKRRNANSLIWETTKENETLYYYDSILTLSLGSAKLYLKDQTELQLSENTLVTLEEPSVNSGSEIRLRFSKGDMRARNPVAKANIQGDDWVVNLEKGSEVALRKDKDSYEFEVISGKASLQTAAGTTENLSDSSILKLGANQLIKKIEKSEELQWSDKKPLRVYVFEDSAKVSLDWTGEADSLNINRVGEDEKKQPLLETQKSTAVDLKLGNYKVRLADKKGLSSTRTVEVWRAPRIFLKKPLPRDRLKIGEPQEFVWSSEKEIKKYQLRFGEKSEASIENFKTLQFDSEQDINWRVEGFDDEGYLIPSFYDSKIYLRKNPLEAPKLKVPSMQPPEKQKGGSFKFKWWKILMAEAFAAQKNSEVNFEWESVEGADLYTIEVSSDPEFRRPEVIETTKSTQFLWKKYDAKKKYYWRVAAGNAKGRMGIFSEPVELKPSIEKAIVVAKPEIQQEVQPEAPVAEKPVEKPDETPAPAEPEISEPIVLPSGWAFAWAPSYKLTELKSQPKAEQITKIQLLGFVAKGLQLEFKKNKYHLQFWTNTESWKPKPVSEFPFQENLSIAENWLYLSKENLGLSLHQSFIPLRKTDESISTQLHTVIGFRYLLNNYGVSIGTSGSLHELNLDYSYKKYLSSNEGKIKYFYGIGGAALYQVHKDGGGYQGNLIFLIGAESF